MADCNLPHATEFTERVKTEILADIESGTIPPTVKTFSDLHQFVDANCYGTSEALVEQFGLAPVVELINASQPALNEWLAALAR